AFPRRARPRPRRPGATECAAGGTHCSGRDRAVAFRCGSGERDGTPMRRVLWISLLCCSWPIAGRAQDPCADPAACCVDPATCVITDKQTLASLTVDAVLPGVPDGLRIGQYVAGGDELTGVTPSGFPDNRCGLSYEFIEYTPEFALSAIDHV